jgi:hypothetical protein
MAHMNRSTNQLKSHRNKARVALAEAIRIALNRKTDCS